MAGLGIGVTLAGRSTQAGTGGALPALSFSPAITRAEGASGTTAFTFTLQLARNGSTAAIPFTWSVMGAGSMPADVSDFAGGVLPSGSGVFAAGETVRALTVTVAADSAAEPNEGFVLTASASVPLPAATVNGTILNDDTETPALLPLTERLAFAGNSYLAQGGNIDAALWAWIGAGCRGVPSIGMRQARGGDRLSHLLDRVEPLQAVRAGCYIVMNPINDASEISANTQAAGDAMLSRFDAVTSALRSVRADARIVAETVGAGVSTYTSKPVSMARYEAGIDARAGADPRIIKFSPNGAVDFADIAQSSDAVHPNRRVSARGGIL